MKKFTILVLFCFLVGCSIETEDNIIVDDNNVITDYLVDVKGAVLYPGIYVIKSNAILQDVVNLAGGFLSNADTSKLNLAKKISNNEMIIIPFSSQTDQSGLVNINTASLEELMTIPKIGQAKAQAIIDYRNTSGPFFTIADIKKVSGISDVIYQQIKTYICIA